MKPIPALFLLIAAFRVVAVLFPLQGQQTPQTLQIPVPGTTVTTPPQQIQVPATTVTAPGQTASVPPSNVSVSVALQGLPPNCSVSWTNTGTSILGTVNCTTVTPLSITTPIALPQAIAGKLYSTDISLLAAPKGGVPPYSYTLGSDAPSWLSITAAGVVSGTPPAAGNLSFSFTVSDSAGVASALSTHLKTTRGGR